MVILKTVAGLLTICLLGEIHCELYLRSDGSAEHHVSTGPHVEIEPANTSWQSFGLNLYCDSLIPVANTTVPSRVL